jgi:hypothetical protein
MLRKARRVRECHVVYIHTHQVAELFVSLKFGNDVVGLRKTLTLSAETILYASAIYLG